MIKGLTDLEYKIVREILSRYDGEFYAYGSRVKGNFSALSDLDIMVKNTEFDKIMADLKRDFDESDLPFVVNFVDFTNIDKRFYELIKNDLVRVV